MPSRFLINLVLLSALSLVAAAALAEVPSHDKPGSHDSPLVSRFSGSTIIGYHTVDFDQVMLPVGKFARGKFTKTETLAGKVTDIAYAAPAGKSAFEVFHNYQAALHQAGFVTRFQCDNNACGDNNFGLSNVFVPDALLTSMTNANSSPYRIAVLETVYCNGGKFHFVTAHLERPQGNADLSLLVCGNSGHRVGVMLKTVEEKPMTIGEVTVNAKALSQGLAQNGHIALAGIHFATDSSTLTKNSDAQLKQMVKLLTSQPHLKVYIVGHTDNTGRLQHNITLSQQRAAAVVKALESRGIAASRMAAKGLASYAPVASNETTAGRARNRRVELVKQ